MHRTFRGGRKLRHAVMLLVSFGALAGFTGPAGAAEIVVWNGSIGPIYKANADGTHPTEIPLPLKSAAAFPNCRTDGFQCLVTGASLSPDGTRIAFSTFGGDLYTADLNGGSLHRLVTSQKAVSLAGCYSSVGGCALERYWQAEWSPDSSKLVLERRGPYANTDFGGAIYTVNADGSDLREVVNWAAAQYEPGFSSDGQRIVFLSGRTPSGAALPRKAIYTTAADGSDPRLVAASSEQNYDNPTWMGGPQILYNNFATYEVKSDIFGINPDGSGFRSLTATSGTYEAQPDYSSTGRRDAFASWTPDGPNEIAVANADGTSRRTILSGIDYSIDGGELSMGQGAYIGGDGQAAEDAEALAALEDYAPTVRYDNEEAYRADSPAIMTDWWENRLERANGGTVGFEGTGNLSIGFLGDTYADGEPATESDELDAAGSESNLALAAQTMHLDSAYADRTYGRRVVGSDGRTWLQYWLFYYSNPGVSGSGGFGMHEGDWEMVQYRMKEDGSEPDLAVYAAHKEKIKCSWQNVQKDPATGGPIAFVAVNSHASYFETGLHGLPATAVDRVEGDGESVRPAVTLLDTERWLHWPGFWGGTHPRVVLGRVGTDQSSPRGPMFQNPKWSDPSEWAASATDTCVADGGGTRGQGSGPPQPRFSSQRIGDSIQVEYEIPTSSDGADPTAIGVTVDRPGGSQLPALAIEPAGDGTGTVTIPVPQGSGDLTVRVSSYAGSGEKSRAAVAPVGKGSG